VFWTVITRLLVIVIDISKRNAVSIFVYPDDGICGFHRNAIFICTIRHAVVSQQTVNLQLGEVKNSTVKVKKVTSAVELYSKCLRF
jgi:hypothetical protein